MSWLPIGTLTNDTTIVECNCGTLVREGNEGAHACQMRCTETTELEGYGTIRCSYTNNHEGEHYANTFGDAGEITWP